MQMGNLCENQKQYHVISINTKNVCLKYKLIVTNQIDVT